MSISRRVCPFTNILLTDAIELRQRGHHAFLSSKLVFGLSFASYTHWFGSPLPLCLRRRFFVQYFLSTSSCSTSLTNLDQITSISSCVILIRAAPSSVSGHRFLCFFTSPASHSNGKAFLLLLLFSFRSSTPSSPHHSAPRRGGCHNLVRHEAISFFRSLPKGRFITQHVLKLSMFTHVSTARCTID